MEQDQELEDSQRLGKVSDEGYNFDAKLAVSKAKGRKMTTKQVYKSLNGNLEKVQSSFAENNLAWS